MFERFTDGARRAVVAMNDEARALNHTVLGSGHLLLALIRDPSSFAAETLAERGLGYDDVRKVAEIIYEKGTPGAELPFTDEAKDIFWKASFMATVFGEKHIDVEHLTFALFDVNSAPTEADV